MESSRRWYADPPAPGLAVAVSIRKTLVTVTLMAAAESRCSCCLMRYSTRGLVFRPGSSRAPSPRRQLWRDTPAKLPNNWRLGERRTGGKATRLRSRDPTSCGCPRRRPGCLLPRELSPRGADSRRVRLGQESSRWQRGSGLRRQRGGCRFLVLMVPAWSASRPRRAGRRQGGAGAGRLELHDSVTRPLRSAVSSGERAPHHLGRSRRRRPSVGYPNPS